MRAIHYEQAVYGSFPFWNRGYSILSHSAGCRAEWLGALSLAGQRFGERPAGVAESPCLFALRLRRGPWMVVGVFPIGSDDQGRPGALAFHGLFVSPWNYLRAGTSPFPFACAFRRHWREPDLHRRLSAGRLFRADLKLAPTRLEDHRVALVVEALKQGRKVVLTSPQPIDDLASAVWTELPGWIRRKASVATWAFGTANGFDLVAVPRLTGIKTGPSELVFDTNVSDSTISQGDHWPAATA
jgi:hypothetical protein